MQSTIVNIRKNILCGHYDNFKDWMDDSNNVYIGKPIIINKKLCPANKSEWYNPYNVSKKMTYDQSLQMYKKYLIEMLKDEECLARFKMLRGKNLGCWCKPGQCHGDIIVKLLNDIERNM
uniref:DUF4326 domain-containing protein n=1 Tax=viral metagenome TaxID=1070528 RepID=A0A6C0C7M0_9ZZZZ